MNTSLDIESKACLFGQAGCRTLVSAVCVPQIVRYACLQQAVCSTVLACLIERYTCLQTSHICPTNMNLLHALVLHVYMLRACCMSTCCRLSAMHVCTPAMCPTSRTTRPTSAGKDAVM
eukprot:1138993-Pelagomonas_calceolata.AAC.6